MLREARKNEKAAEEPWIAHFGGSFNPVHQGHLAIAEQLLESYSFERILLTPNSSHYAKAGLAPEVDRLALLEIATRYDHRLVVRDIELGHTRATRTLDTVRQLHNELEAISVLSAR